MDSEHITIKQVILRVLSVIVAAIGVAACARSLIQQTTETADLMVTATWFIGLLGLTAACAGYACTTTPHGKKNRVVVSVVLGIALCALILDYEINNLYIDQTIIFSVMALLVQAVVLVIYHFILRAQDKDAQ